MTIKSIGLIAALALVGAACGTKEAQGPLEPTSTTGRVRFVNLINDPTQIPVNAILESVPFGVNLGYGATTPSTLPSPRRRRSTSPTARHRTWFSRRRLTRCARYQQELRQQPARLASF